MFEHESYAGHEQVVFREDRRLGLRAVIAIHDTTLGPAAGGCRMWPYPDAQAAVRDALRLSEAMTWKNALAGLPLGGGKAVILGEARRAKPELFRRFGEFVQELAGRYWTAEDVGVGFESVGEIASSCDFVFGRKSGDPSPYTALGGRVGIEASLAYRRGGDNLSGIHVAVQGLGNVGGHLCTLLHEAGAELTVTDVVADAVTKVVASTGASAVAPDEIFDVDADVLAPCALGGVLNDETIPRLRVGIVSGLANNQLGESRHAAMLAERGILYAPDYVVNAGGMLAVSAEIMGEETRGGAALRDRVLGIRGRLEEIFRRADADGEPPAAVADRMARELVGRA
jgi:leucine dehydrogenase